MTCRVCEEDPKIVEKVKGLGERFCAQYTQSAHLYPNTHIDFAQKRLELAESLFYKLLENILKDEIKKPNFDCNVSFSIYSELTVQNKVLLFVW